MIVPVGTVLGLSAVLFGIGVFGFLARRNIILMLVSVEVMLNAVNLSLVGFSRHLEDPRGQVLALFVIAVAAAEAAVGLGLLIALNRTKPGAGVAGPDRTQMVTFSLIPLFAVLVSALGALLIACTGERRANLRGILVDCGRWGDVRSCRLHGPGGPGRSHAGVCAVPDPPGYRTGLSGGCLRPPVCLGGIAALDLDFVLLDRLHAFS